MSKYLPNLDELIPITNDKTTFYDCGFNVDFNKLDFKKKLEVVNNLVRQSMIADCRPGFDDVDTLIGNCHTACKASMKYLKELGLGDEIYYVFARIRKFDPSDKTTIHAILLIKHGDKVYQYDPTPYVGYKYGYVEDINVDRWYEEYTVINDEISSKIDLIKEIIYSDYHKTYDESKTNSYIKQLMDMERIEIMHGFIVHAYESILNHIYNKYDYDRIVNRIMVLNPYDKRNKENFDYKNGLVIKQAKLWQEELDSLDDSNPKRKLELAQNIVQELKFVYPEIEKRALINGKNYRLSTITPRVLMENGLNVIMIKPSAYYMGIEDIIREKFGNGMCEYSVNLGEKTKDTHIEPMLFSHPLGVECKRAYTGKNDIMFMKMDSKTLKEIKNEIRKLGEPLYGKSVIWTDGMSILFDRYTTNLVHTTDSYAEGCLHYLMGYPEHQLMTRFMYPNLKLERIKKDE